MELKLDEIKDIIKKNDNPQYVPLKICINPA